MSNSKHYIKDFVAYLKIEKGLSENSIEAYLNDVLKLENYSRQNGKEISDLGYNDLKNFVSELYDLGLSARSQARIISGIKQFYLFLILENILQNDPSELLEMPKIGRKLPEVLSVEIS